MSDLLTYLFRPSREAVDGCKRSMSDFVNWGPFQLIGELSSLQNVQSGQKANIGIPVVIPYRRNDPLAPGDLPLGQSTWYNTGTTVPVVPDALTQTNGFAWVRVISGVGVWLVFVFFLARKLFPNHVV